jgi:hypothetical protein
MSVEFVKNVIIDGTDNPYPGGAADYESKVKVSLDAIKGTETGTTVLGFFALRSHRVWIVPPAEPGERRSGCGERNRRFSPPAGSCAILTAASTLVIASASAAGPTACCTFTRSTGRTA